MKIIDKLSTYAALIGVISAIGGGFYAWGEFNTRLSAMEKKPRINLTPLKDGLKETNTNLSIAKIDLIDRIKKVEDNGGQVLMPKTAIPYVGWISKFLDTEGNLFCAMQYDNDAR